MVSPVIITFKRYPELGRLRLSNYPALLGCGNCALLGKQCGKLDKNPSGVNCGDDDYIYEKVSDK